MTFLYKGIFVCLLKMSECFHWVVLDFNKIWCNTLLYIVIPECLASIFFFSYLSSSNISKKAQNSLKNVPQLFCLSTICMIHFQLFAKGQKCSAPAPLAAVSTFGRSGKLAVFSTMIYMFRWTHPYSNRTLRRWLKTLKSKPRLLHPPILLLWPCHF